MFLVLGSKMKHKKAIENRTAEYFCLHHQFSKFLGIFAALGLVSNMFTMFSGIQKYALKDVIHTVILAI